MCSGRGLLPCQAPVLLHETIDTLRWGSQGRSNCRNLTHFPQLISRRDIHGGTALHYACQRRGPLAAHLTAAVVRLDPASRFAQVRRTPAALRVSALSVRE